MQQTTTINILNAVDAIQEGGITVDKLITEALPDQKTYIAPWLAQNTISLVASQRGVGKSWFLHILASMLTHKAEGLCLEPWMVHNRANVMLIDGELSEHDLQNRFKGLIEWDPPLSDLLVFSKNRQHRMKLPSPNLADKNWREGIYEYVRDNTYDIIMFDNMSCLAPGLDELRKQEWDPIVEFFLNLRFAGKTVLFAHHLGKQGGNGPRGSSSLEDPVDYSIRLDKDGKEHGKAARFKVVFTKARHLLGDTNAEIAIGLENHDDGSVGCLSHIAKPIQEKTSKEADIIKLLLVVPKLSQAAISTELDVTPQYVSKVKQNAMTNGLLEETEDKRVLTQRGKEVYDDVKTSQQQVMVESR